MGDNDVLGKIFSAAAGVWAIFLAVVVTIFKAWPAIMGRSNERRRDREAAEAGDWERLRNERDVAREERDLVRDRWAECETERIEWMGRAIAAEAIVQGQGVVREQAAAIIAAERLAADKRSKKP